MSDIYKSIFTKAHFTTRVELEKNCATKQRYS